MCVRFGARYDPTHISDISKATCQPILMRFPGNTSNIICNKGIKYIDCITSKLC